MGSSTEPTLNPRAATRVMSSREPVRKCQRLVSAAYFWAYAESACGVSCSGLTEMETNSTSGYDRHMSWRDFRFFVMMGQMPLQVVKKNAVTQTLLLSRTESKDCPCAS